MGRVSKTVTLSGMDEMLAKSSNPIAVAEGMKDLLVKAGNEGVEETKRLLEGGTGKAVNSIIVNVTSSAASVKSMMSGPTVRSIDKGRKRRAYPVRQMLPALSRWGHAVGLNEKQIEHIAVRLYKNGSTGKKFIQTTHDKVEIELPHLLEELATKIKSWWN